MTALLVSFWIGPRLIRWLKKKQREGQPIRLDGPESHLLTKKGTPTMGGVLILLALSTATLLWADLSNGYVWVALIVTLGYGLIGFADDYLKVRRRRSLGLSARWKMLGLVLLTFAFAFAVESVDYLDTEIYFPVIDVNIDLSYGYYMFLFLVLAGTANGVNLTDGIDGLAAGTALISLLTFLAIAAIDWIRSGQPGARSDDFLDLAIVSAALIGGVIGFLWYNAHPAEVFMGDTGSMALGGAIAGLAIMTETEILLVLIGGIFVIEALSVIVQVISFRRFGRRVFLMAPIHHHFEMKAWSDTKIIVRFWIIAALCAGSGFVLYYLRADQFS
jgi:phospho-N-acetylmuramoyl-pentapeptide-transferase